MVVLTVSLENLCSILYIFEILFKPKLKNVFHNVKMVETFSVCLGLVNNLLTTAFQNVE